MPNIHGTKWGNPTIGTPGGTVTWSIAGGKESLTSFGIFSNSVNGKSFMNFNFQKVISNAFATWSKYGNIQFTQVPDDGGPAGFADDGDIRIFFGKLPGQVLGLGAFPSNSSFGGDILLDVRGAYNTNRALFKGLVLHEIGHALGLDHTSINSIMTPVLQFTSLQRDDRDAMRLIYGNPVVAPTYDIKGSGVFRIKSKNNDLIAEGNGQKNIIFGTSGDDTIDGGGSRDKLFGGAGADDLRGGNGKDALSGGAGADILNGGSGFDTADYRKSGSILLDLLQPANNTGDAQGDTLISIERIIGSVQGDTILGDGNDNRILGYHGNDFLDGRGGHDSLSGGNGGDTLIGGNGDDSLEGEYGDDLLEGGAGNDTLRGSRDDDTLKGGDGNDVLRGGGNNDVIEGGAGDDNLRGNANADTFIFADGHGNDTIGDFNTRSSTEVIDLTGLSSLNSWADVQAASVNTGQGVLSDTGSGDSILLNNVSRGMLSFDDFIF